MTWPGPDHLAPPGSFHQLLLGWPAPGPVTAAGLGSEWCWLGSGRPPRGLLLPPGHHVDQCPVSAELVAGVEADGLHVGRELSALRLLASCLEPQLVPFQTRGGPQSPGELRGHQRLPRLGQADGS